MIQTKWMTILSNVTTNSIEKMRFQYFGMGMIQLEMMELACKIYSLPFPTL